MTAGAMGDDREPLLSDDDHPDDGDGTAVGFRGIGSDAGAAAVGAPYSVGGPVGGPEGRRSRRPYEGGDEEETPPAPTVASRISDGFRPSTSGTSSGDGPGLRRNRRRTRGASNGLGALPSASRGCNRDDAADAKILDEFLLGNPLLERAKGGLQALEQKQFHLVQEVATELRTENDGGHCRRRRPQELEAAASETAEPPLPATMVGKKPLLAPPFNHEDSMRRHQKYFVKEDLQAQVEPKAPPPSTSRGSGSSLSPENQPPRFSWPDNWIGVVPRGLADTVDASYETLNYTEPSSFLRRVDDAAMTSGLEYVKKEVMYWVPVLIIGPLTALVALAIEQGITLLASFKYRLMGRLIETFYDGTVSFGSMVPCAYSVGANALFCLVAGLLVWYSPEASGSGIPQVKCYLNGINVPRLVRIRTLVCKAAGVAFSVIGGLAVGKEGPMIHSGAAIGAGMSQGKSTSLEFSTTWFKQFRNDADKRDYVACGSAAGVAAAFGAPLGGLLFVVEEGASHLNHRFLWRAAICSCSSFFTLVLMKSVILGEPGQISSGGLISFGKFEDASYNIYQMAVFCLMGLVGGVSGGAFNQLNKVITQVRMKHQENKLVRLAEVIFNGVTVALLAYTMTLLDPQCEPLHLDPEATVYIKMNCEEGTSSVSAALWYKTPEKVVRMLFHDSEGPTNFATIIVFAIINWFLVCWTFGMTVSSGLFVPSLLIGAAWGRALGIFLNLYIPHMNWGCTGKFALFGAVAQLAGNVRLTYSLTAIIMEATGNLTYLFPVFITVAFAKHLGDVFNAGIYDIHINLSGIPMLEDSAPPKLHLVSVKEVMARPVRTLPMRVRLREALQLLSTSSHNGFPIVDTPCNPDKDVPSFGRLRGLVLRDDLVTMIAKKMYVNAAEHGQEVVMESYATLRQSYPRCPGIEDVSEEDQDRYFVDLSLVMDPAPPVIRHLASFTVAYDLYRQLGLRHIVVIDNDGQVVGMLTRRDLFSLEVENGLGHAPKLVKKLPVIKGIRRTPTSSRQASAS